MAKRGASGRKRCLESMRMDAVTAKAKPLPVLAKYKVRTRSPSRIPLYWKCMWSTINSPAVDTHSAKPFIPSGSGFSVKVPPEKNHAAVKRTISVTITLIR